MADTPKKDFPFNIGIDPEFTLELQNKRVDARKTITATLEKDKNFIKYEDGFQVGKAGNIGWDHAQQTAEIRTTPEKNPEKIINHIQAILDPFIPKMSLFNMSTLSEYASIGGHIHFETPKQEIWTRAKQEQVHRRMASFYLPIMLTENPTNIALRIKQKYGTMSDYRYEQHFTHPNGNPGYTYEFRCPSAEWLTTPKIAKAVIAYMAVVYNEITSHPRKFMEYSDVIYKTRAQGESLQMLAITDFNILTKTLVTKIRKYIQKFEMYESYKEEIEYLFKTAQVIKDKEKANFNIIEGWGFKLPTQVSKKTLLSEKILKEKIKEIDLDANKNITNIRYNNDTKVEDFVLALNTRVAAFKWRLKNTYYLFGMRKGIPEIISRDIYGNYLTGQKQIKTKQDLITISQLFDKMWNKFKENQIYRSETPIIDFKEGKIKTTQNNTICIGLPYEMRLKGETRPFIELIWDIENQIAKAEKYSEKQIKELKEGQGEISKILLDNGDKNKAVYFDEKSMSGDNQRRAISEILMEQQENEIDEEIDENQLEENLDEAVNEEINQSVQNNLMRNSPNRTESPTENEPLPFERLRMIAEANRMIDPLQ